MADTPHVLIAPSVLSADFCNLKKDLSEVETADYIHFDVMDGSFVPNISFGPDILKAVKRSSTLPVDCHLMVQHPESVIDLFIDAGADMITFHVEATNHAHRLLSYIKSKGVQAGIVLCPQTSISSIEYLLDLVDVVLIMSVNPGFGGQKFIPSALTKIRELKILCEKHQVSPIIEVDGGVTAHNARELYLCGASMLVAGSAIFNASNKQDAIEAIRTACTKEA